MTGKSRARRAYFSLAWVVSLTRASALDGTGWVWDVHMKLPLLEFFGPGASDRMQMDRQEGSRGEPKRR